MHGTQLQSCIDVNGKSVNIVSESSVNEHSGDDGQETRAGVSQPEVTGQVS